MSATLYQYAPAVTAGPNGTDPRPTAPASATEDAPGPTQLAEIDGVRYVSVPDGLVPDVPDAIAETWQPAAITDALLSQLRTASPQLHLIDQQLQAKIRAKYTLEDELYFARIAVGALQGTYEPTPAEMAKLDAYQLDVESIRDWARAARAALGCSSTQLSDPTPALNVNTATQSELESLPGVGAALAQEIVAGRPWTDTSDLSSISGISQAMLDSWNVTI